jgi:multidrug resistance efflux pump
MDAIGNRKSAMVRLYEQVDGELITRVDEKGVIRVSHTDTANANAAASETKFESAEQLKSQRAALKAGGARKEDVRPLKKMIRQTEMEARVDAVEATYHGALAQLNHAIGRE